MGTRRRTEKRVAVQIDRTVGSRYGSVASRPQVEAKQEGVKACAR